MFNVLFLVTFDGGIDEEGRTSAAESLDGLVAALPGLAFSRIRPSLEGSVNGGDLVCIFGFPNEAIYRSAKESEGWTPIAALCSSSEVKRWDWAAYPTEALGLREPEIAAGVHRLLLLAVAPSTDIAKVGRFEAEMRAMPDYVDAIRNWRFSHVTESGGARLWTHVWEQEFADPQGLFGPYMMHPIHFAHIDRWFDTESHDWIVDPELCSTYCAFEASALALPVPNVSS